MALQLNIKDTKQDATALTAVERLNILETLRDSLSIFQQLYNYNPAKYNVFVEIAQCKESIKVLEDKDAR